MRQFIYYLVFMTHIQALPESQLLNYLFLKTILIINYDAMNLLPLTVNPDCDLERFQEEIASVGAEGQSALIELRAMYREALITDRQRADKIKQIIEYFVFLDQDANAQIDFIRMTPAELQRVFNIHFFRSRIVTQSMFFFSERPENIEGLTAEQLNDCGWHFYQKKYYEEAVPYFQLAALAGQEQALVNLGVCYHWAQGIEKDDEASVLCFELAADKNNPQALYNLGMAYEEGWYNGESNTKQAQNYYIRAAGLKDSESICQLGWYAENGIYPVTQNFEEAYRHYENADKLGSARAAFNLGRCYEFAKGCNEDLSNALECYQRAQERGYAKAEGAIARIEDKLNRASCILL